MAHPIAASEALCALRREIARIEGKLPSLAPAPASSNPTPITTAKAAQSFEAAIGGLPREGLVEIITAQARDAAAAVGFALAMAVHRTIPDEAREAPPILWIGTATAFAELGTPSLPGIQALLGRNAPPLLVVRTARLTDALWAAEEAVGAGVLGPILVEAEGPHPALGLLATRRLHRRAQARGRMLLLLRHAGRSASGEAEPTAAPLRLAVGHAPARPRTILGRALPGTLGRPAFTVTVCKSRVGSAASFILDWNADEQRFTEWPATHPGAVVSPSRDGPDPAPAPSAVLAFASAPVPLPGPSGDQPQGEQPPHPLRARRAG